MRIGEMVRRTGVSERLLRYYEEQGLLAPSRLPSGYRVYRAEDVDTVRRVRTLLTAGLTTETIARVLPCLREQDDRRLVPICSDLVTELRTERERITRAIQELQASRGMLDAVIEAGPTTDPADVAPGTAMA
ncbi:MerR family transcriptional regulator [Streptomyces sp. LaPpAH-108]|uniref:MerR family transcriptional regulator n=1 Tax=Streptomyces sp. LaPpAH-108 TaxID=1155714 RepID=UPI00036A2B13|nr:MerR family transcriptional regulator [Streptomyces sp. LaPpAH-108]